MRRTFFVGVFFLALAAFLASCAAPPTQKESPRRGVPVIVYHDVPAEAKNPGQNVISMARFEEQMKYLHDAGYTAVGVSDLLRYLAGDSLPEKSVVLTFDEGWKSMKDVVPVLRKYGFKAAFSIIVRDGIGGKFLDWNDIRKIARDPHFELGSHTMTRPCDEGNNLLAWSQGLARLREPSTVRERLEVSKLRHEIHESKSLIESVVGRKAVYLAWPCGLYNEGLMEMAKDAEYAALLTADEGANRPGDDPHRIKRVVIDGRCGLDTFKRVLEEPRSHTCPEK